MTSPPDDVSVELIRRVQAGDREAWESLYARCRDRLLFSIRCGLGSRLRQRLESEDILQSVMKDAVLGLGAFEPHGSGAIEHYLNACALNKIRAKAEYYGAAKRAGDVPLSPSAAERLPDRGLRYLDGDRFERLERGLAVLPENMREVVILRMIDNLSNGDAARVLDKSAEATSKLFGRAMARLGSWMRDSGGD